ncbi:MAG: hypothetical protein ACRCVT_02135 [Leadbetterella sp.]
MKKVSLFLLGLILSLQGYSNILRVNNNPGVVLVTNKVFSSFFAANSFASSGDTIYLEPSDINYGNITLNKKITIIGPGYLLSKNPNTPFDKRTASFSNISTSNNNIDGTKLFGFEVKNSAGVYGDITLSVSANDVEIFGCIFNDLRVSSGNTARSFNISNNIILNNIRHLGTTTGYSGCNFSNNIILGSVSESDNDNIFKNNIIYGGATFLGKFFNNIIFQNNTVGFEFNQSSKVFNNVCVGCTGTSANNNFFTTAASTIFNTAEPRNLDDLRDDAFQLPSISPAKGKGVGGIDCGVFAGATPYVLSGIPPYPMLTNFSQAPISGSNLPITISIKRN